MAPDMAACTHRVRDRVHDRHPKVGDGLPRGNVGVDDVAMTAMVKDELSRVECTKTSERKAEVTALLRFSGGLHIVGGRVVIEAELDTGSVARRLRRDISEVYGYTSGVSVLAGGNIRRGVRYLVRIAKHGEGLARQTGLVDQRGPAGPRAAAVGRVGRDQRRRGRVARRVPRARLADRARPVVLAGGHLPRTRGGDGAGRRRPPARHPGQGP